jgi:hypothetical protein
MFIILTSLTIVIYSRNVFIAQVIGFRRRKIVYNIDPKEVLSWKYGQVKTLKILPTPENVFGSPDNFAHCRPLIVMVDSTGPGTPFSSASFTSLKTGEVVSILVFNNDDVFQTFCFVFNFLYYKHIHLRI